MLLRPPVRQEMVAVDVEGKHHRVDGIDDGVSIFDACCSLRSTSAAVFSVRPANGCCA
jgi:hypothetical protein